MYSESTENWMLFHLDCYLSLLVMISFLRFVWRKNVDLRRNQHKRKAFWVRNNFLAENEVPQSFQTKNKSSMLDRYQWYEIKMRHLPHLWSIVLKLTKFTNKKWSVEGLRKFKGSIYYTAENLKYSSKKLEIRKDSCYGRSRIFAFPKFCN